MEGTNVDPSSVAENGFTSHLCESVFQTQYGSRDPMQLLHMLPWRAHLSRGTRYILESVEANIILEELTV